LFIFPFLTDTTNAAQRPICKASVNKLRKRIYQHSVFLIVSASKKPSNVND